MEFKVLKHLTETSWPETNQLVQQQVPTYTYEQWINARLLQAHQDWMSLILGSRPTISSIEALNLRSSIQAYSSGSKRRRNIVATDDAASFRAQKSDHPDAKVCSTFKSRQWGGFSDRKQQESFKDASQGVQ